MKDQLLTSNSKKKLNDYMTIVSKKKRLKEENQKRRSINVLPPPPSSSRKPLRPTNLNNTVTKSSNLNSTVTKPSLNTTVTIKKIRKPSLELASCPPWYVDSLPRFHSDPVTAVSALNNLLGL